MKAETLRTLMRGLFRALTTVQTQDLDHIPASGPCLLAVNHLSRLDGPLVLAYVRRPDLTAIVTDKYQAFPLMRWVVDTVGGIWINRGSGDVDAIRAARAYLQTGGALGIAPEGTRSTQQALLPAKTGVAYLADITHVPVVPLAMWGTERVFNELVRLRRPRIGLRAGPALHLPPVARKTREADLQRNTDEIMAQLAALLPPAYRGAYADHPRLLELLAEGGAAGR
jgi:1-acyl-sn-glycerol-3-phosphate acyltransferase